jgi:hypothetical protein
MDRPGRTMSDTGASVVQGMRWFHITFILLSVVMVAKFLGLF